MYNNNIIVNQEKKTRPSMEGNAKVINKKKFKKKVDKEKNSLNVKLLSINEDNGLSYKLYKKQNKSKKLKDSKMLFNSQSNHKISGNCSKSLSSNLDSKKSKIKTEKQKHQSNDSKLVDFKSSFKNIKKRMKTNNLSQLSDKTEDVNQHYDEQESSDPDEQVSSDSDEQESSDEEREIRNELGSFSVYKKIQTLLQKNPSLSLCCAEETSDNLACDKDESSKNVDSNFPKIKNKIIEKKPEISTKKSLNAALDKNENFKLTEKAKEPIEIYQEKGMLCRELHKKVKENSFKNKAREKLQAAKFRYLNEKLYTESGKDSFNHFQKNVDDFLDYHTGYSLQVSKWPLNPVDKIISSLHNLKKNSVIVDMGCGDAKIARTLSKYSVVSYDLISLNEHVIACDFSKVPLLNESVDVVVFCLSLMGINLKDYLREAHRITKLGGLLKIAEVESRISNLNEFIKCIESFGFKSTNKIIEHKLFVFLDFKKIKKEVKKTQEIILRPCLYKKR